MKVQIWSHSGAGGYSLICKDKKLELSSGEPVKVAIWKAAQLAICLDCPIFLGIQQINPKKVERPDSCVRKGVKHLKNK